MDAKLTNDQSRKKTQTQEKQAAAAKAAQKQVRI
jgi:hypothetical protein